jgi:rubrerythrin
VVDKKRIIRKKWMAKKEERHKGMLTKKTSTGRAWVCPLPRREVGTYGDAKSL